ncbi:heme exporter protein CcmD [Marinibaculum pumilum]|uniref:Heme exporter protein D n=1 Tax=Marinibaculum pumilum TaxID=1766165 RepID=A0ABV7KXS1_9PROT
MDFPGRFDSLGAFLAMGGYGAFVWPALALAVVILLGLWLQSLAALREAVRQEALVAQLRRDGRSGGTDRDLNQGQQQAEAGQ